MFVLEAREWMQIWGKVLSCASPSWRTAWQIVWKEWWQKCSGHVENYTRIGLRISRYGAAEVFINLAEKLKHTETNQMCSIHECRCTSCWHSRPKSINWNDLPRWSSSAWPQCSKIWGSVSGRDEWQERCAREAAWKLAKNILKFKEKHQTAFFSPSEK